MANHNQIRSFFIPFCTRILLAFWPKLRRIFPLAGKSALVRKESIGPRPNSLQFFKRAARSRTAAGSWSIKAGKLRTTTVTKKIAPQLSSVDSGRHCSFQTERRGTGGGTAGTKDWQGRGQIRAGLGRKLERVAGSAAHRDSIKPAVQEFARPR